MKSEVGSGSTFTFHPAAVAVRVNTITAPVGRLTGFVNELKKPRPERERRLDSKLTRPLSHTC